MQNDPFIPYIEQGREWMELAIRAQQKLQKMQQESSDNPPDPMGIQAMMQACSQYYTQHPDQFQTQQREFTDAFADLWQQTARHWIDGSWQASPQTTNDKRFKNPAWDNAPYFAFIKQAYTLWSDHMLDNVHGIDDLDIKSRHKMEFFTRQMIDALSPSNFAVTNPDVMEEALKTNGQSLLNGFRNFVHDLEQGQITMTDNNAFEVGKNLAATKGAVIYQNDFIQLIQYAPTTKEAHKTPLLIIPPWINKYYILDMRPENSFVKYCVDQGHSVFLISWVNPDASFKACGFADYMERGILDSLAAIEKVTNEKQVNTVGYCIGGTLLTMTLAYLEKDTRIKSATFLTTLIDFEDSGDLKVFMDDAQLNYLEHHMRESGIMEAQIMQTSFSMLRANDLIWSYIVNNYLLGRQPMSFDLLYWNSDSTNIPASLHMDYLRRLYRDNALIEKEAYVLKDKPLDLGTIKTPSYFLSAKDDHIAPWQATYAGPQHFGGDVTFTLASSGHVAGVVNPPATNKYSYFTHDKLPDDSDAWLKKAKEHKGSWWPHWIEWLAQYAGEKVKPRPIKKAIQPAPGSYVRRRA